MNCELGIENYEPSGASSQIENYELTSNLVMLLGLTIKK